MRRSRIGWPATVSVGYKQTNLLRGLHPSGKEEVIVSNMKELERVKSDTQVARLSHTIGERKKVTLIEKAKELNIRILNPRLKKKEPEEQPQIVAAEEPETLVVGEEKSPGEPTEPAAASEAQGHEEEAKKGE